MYNIAAIFVIWFEIPLGTHNKRTKGEKKIYMYSDSIIISLWGVMGMEILHGHGQDQIRMAH